MLSLSKCRQLVGGNSELSDSQLEELRNQLYILAGIIISSAPPPSGRNNEPSQVGPLPQQADEKGGLYSKPCLARILPDLE